MYEIEDTIIVRSTMIIIIEEKKRKKIIVEEESSLKLAGSDYSFIFSDLPHFEDENETRNDN